MLRIAFQCVLVWLMMFGSIEMRAEIPVEVEKFYPETMNAAPPLPADLSHQAIGCQQLRSRQPRTYRTSHETDYSTPEWQQRITADWQFFSASADLGRMVLIDFAHSSDHSIAYRYLGNHDQHDQLYEPWSSSKIFAYTGALAKLRAQGVGARSHIGNVSIADLITSINSYQATGNAPADSNAIATFFANIAGRDALTALFHNEWLMLDNQDVRFRGAYGPTAYEPTSTQWADDQQTAKLSAYKRAIDDPGYQSYRCKDCGLTGNKPMTALAQAEWLKRLATHNRETSTQHPELTADDIQVLFYGENGRGGMMAGISQMLHNALAIAMEPHSDDAAVDVLNRNTQGQWRVFQKIGWGPSETRGAGENVVLAHVCLPHFQGGREFTLAAQTAVPGNGDIFVTYAGIKMQQLLTRSLSELFTVEH